MTNTHYVDDELGLFAGSGPDDVGSVPDDLRRWPLEALATAPVVPQDLLPDAAGPRLRTRRAARTDRDRDPGAQVPLSVLAELIG